MGLFDKPEWYRKETAKKWTQVILFAATMIAFAISSIYLVYLWVNP